MRDKRPPRYPAVPARLLLANAFDLDAYPHRYLLLYDSGFRFGASRRMVEAIELLEEFGWEMVSMFGRTRDLWAAMRRT